MGQATKIITTLFLFSVLFFCNGYAQKNITDISYSHVMSDTELVNCVKPGLAGLNDFYSAREKGDNESALKLLAAYLKEKMAARYYFSWKNFHERFKSYSEKYSGEESSCLKNAKTQMETFPAKTNWILPFKNLKGEEVTAYRLRHLARQDMAFDIALSYYYKNEDTSYLNYFLGQVESLNAAFEKKELSKDIFENFHSGNRILHWLMVNNAFLSTSKYSLKDQLTIIKTLLYHGALLEKSTKKYSYGNHHTKGLVALFSIAVLYPEFTGTDKWLEESLSGLSLHMKREVNQDGFQFERSVHYHIGDIENYFLVYKLAQINKISMPDVFLKRLRGMFGAMVDIAQPNKRLPVLQDDTDQPWAEFNKIEDAMVVGSILFKDKVFRYFSADSIPASLYWYLTPDDSEFIMKEKGVKPNIGSVALSSTGYYVMRNGWNPSDQYMIITAGLSKEKPDHQHGDMLGVVAYSGNNEILPNYQVRYSLPDFEFFKNSWVKNVAFADSIPQGRKWLPNPGGDGFGKWKSLPVPKVLAWKTSGGFDYFAGTHNGYDSLGVNYTREVFFIKDGFWIINDNFSGSNPNSFQQVWQGHYNPVKKNEWIRSSFSNGAGLEIIQLNNPSESASCTTFRGKGNFVFNSGRANNYSFSTLLFPYHNFDSRIPGDSNLDSLVLDNWTLLKNNNTEEKKISGLISNARLIIEKGNNKFFLINTSLLRNEDKVIRFSKQVALFVELKNNRWRISFLTPVEADLQLNKNANIVNGTNNRTVNKNESVHLRPGEEIILEWK